MDQWEQLRQQCMSCRACGLADTRTNVVFGVGSPTAEVLLVGEAPGEHEALEGRPFVGRAGKNLDAFLEGAHIQREELYVTNAVKFRPTRTSAAGRTVNRPPTQEEVEQRLLREALLTGLAEERGLSVTEEEAREYADNINETLEAMKAEGDASAQYMLDSLEAYAAGMDMTYEEYTEEILVPTWRDALLREKLYDRVIAEAAQSADAQEDIWEAFVAQAMAEAEIVYP